MRHFCKFLKPLGVAAVIPMLASCVYETYPEDTFRGPEDGVEINLRIIAGGMVTRSASHTVVTAGEDYEAAINVPAGDFAIFIFDENGNYLDRFEPGQIIVNDMALTNVGGAELYTYNINGVFQPEDDVERVQMLILANWKTFGGDYNEIEDDLRNRDEELPVSDIDYFLSRDADYRFSYSDFINGGQSWNPQGNPGIPMTARSAIYPVSRNIDLGSINALRGLAKIEIVDRAPKEGAKITGCVLTGFNNNARFAPIVSGTTNAGWNTQATLVTTPSFPIEGQAYSDTPISYVGSTRTLVPEKETEEQTRNVYSFYVPEMLLEDGKRPVIQITSETSAKTFEVELANYDGDGKPVVKADGTVDYFANLLRNHLYRFNILALGETVNGELELIIDTDQWDVDNDYLYYDDIDMAFEEPDGYFKWNWDIDNVDPQDALFAEKGLTYEEVAQWSKERLNEEWDSHYLMVQASGESAAVATFTITKPERGKWTLALYGDDDTPKHWFMIEIWNEASQEWVAVDQRTDPSEDSAEHNPLYDSLTGSISPKGEAPETVKIRISAQQLQYTQIIYKARLAMNVTTFDGRMVEVDLVNGRMFTSGTPEADKEYYYIIQYPTMLQ